MQDGAQGGLPACLPVACYGVEWGLLRVEAELSLSRREEKQRGRHLHLQHTTQLLIYADQTPFLQLLSTYDSPLCEAKLGQTRQLQNPTIREK